jgi:uncharacterized RDD family membrane protein YckC
VTLPVVDPGEAVTATVPSLKRRLLCFVYEGVLLFGLVMFSGLVYGLVTQQRHALVGATGLKVFLFAVLGLYFVFFWCRSGQTLAMLTWHIKLVGPDGGLVTRWRALARYVLSWLWFLPALALVYFSGLKGAGPASVVLVVGVLAYAGLAWLRKDRQFWHDAVCQTRLLSCPPRARKNAQ